MISGKHFTKKHSIEERFWARVHKTESCWNWTGAIFGTQNSPRGRIWYDGRTQHAHRVSWTLHFGNIPEGMQVCHRCDNSICVRPDHLFLGTASDNMQDMHNKKRGKRSSGEENCKAKLTEAQVREIKSRYPATGPTVLAREYNVSRKTVQRICYGSGWTHLFGET